MKRNLTEAHHSIFLVFFQKTLYTQNAPFHVVITSYQLVVQDVKYFQRVKWQYMVLDEAQALKSSTRYSTRNSETGTSKFQNHIPWTQMGESCFWSNPCPSISFCLAENYHPRVKSFSTPNFRMLKHTAACMPVMLILNDVNDANI